MRLMGEIQKQRWQSLVESFRLQKRGAALWNALELEENFV
jgi:hypothetical protein